MVKTASPIIEVVGVTKRFDSFIAVDDMTISIMPGDIVGFVGENGAGKTTTINMLLGFTAPSNGEVRLFDEKLHLSKSYVSHQSIGYASGDMALPARMTGRQYLQFVMAQTSGSYDDRLAQLVTTFKPQLDKKITTLSRGNKQKIALIAAFVTNPRLIILDEPTSGLDPVMQDAFLDTIRDIATRGATVLMSSHYLQEVAEICTRVLLMKQGKIVEDLSADQLLSKGGKVVEVVTRHKVTLPKEYALDAVSRHSDERYETSFSYTGEPAQLVKWLSSLTGVIDITINEQTLEQEFRAMYETEGSRHE